MPSSLLNCQFGAVISLNALISLLKTNADLYLVSNITNETTSFWNDTFTVKNVLDLNFTVPDPVFKVLSPSGFNVTYIGIYVIATIM